MGKKHVEACKGSKPNNNLQITFTKSKIHHLPPTAFPSFKNVRSSASPRLEAANYTWLLDQVSSGTQANGIILPHKAEILQKEANKYLPASSHLSLKFSNGCKDRFQKRHALKFRLVHGESLSADCKAIEKELPAILEKIEIFHPRDVWNVCKFGLFYRQPPGWSLATKAPSGYKKDKTRMTFLPSCNSNGFENFPHMIIGNAMRPPPFKGIYGHELGLGYYTNKKALMNKQFFHSWLDRLDRYMVHKKNK